jgi:hypothetical protein
LLAIGHDVPLSGVEAIVAWTASGGDEAIYLWGDVRRSDSFFSTSIGLLIGITARASRSFCPLSRQCLFFFISADIYLMFTGKNAPRWVYGVVVLLILIGALFFLGEASPKAVILLQKAKKETGDARECGPLIVGAS